MDKIEKYFKDKFENFEMDPLPGAFERIQQSMNAGISESTDLDNMTSASSWFKSSSALMKISISMNILFMIALPLVYYYASSKSSEEIKEAQVIENKQVIKIEDKNKITTTTTSTINKPVQSKNKSNNSIGSTNSTKSDEIESSSTMTDVQQSNTSVVEEVQSVTPTVKENSNTKEVVEKGQKNSVVTNSETRKKNIEAYYEDNSSKLKDSTNLLFKKKK